MTVVLKKPIQATITMNTERLSRREDSENLDTEDDESFVSDNPGYGHEPDLGSLDLKPDTNANGSPGPNETIQQLADSVQLGRFDNLGRGLGSVQYKLAAFALQTKFFL